MRGFGQIAELCAFARPARRRDHEHRPGAPGEGRRPRGRRAGEGRARRRAPARRHRRRPGRLRRRARRPRGRAGRRGRTARSFEPPVLVTSLGARRGRLHGAAPRGERADRARDRARARPRAPGAAARRVRRVAEPGAAAARRRRARSTTRGTRTRSRCARRSSTWSRSPPGAGRSPCSARWPSSATTARRATPRSGAPLAELGIDEVVAIGPQARAYGGRWVATATRRSPCSSELLRPGDCVLVKGARRARPRARRRGAHER